MEGYNEWVINPSRHLKTRHKLPWVEVKKIISKAKHPRKRPLRYILILIMFPTVSQQPSGQQSIEIDRGGGEKRWVKAELLSVRDYLIIATLVLNGHRRGVLRNMLTEEFTRARPSEDVHIIAVKNHKMDTVYTARVIVASELWKAYTAYHKQKQLHFGADTEHFLMEADGTQLNLAWSVYSSFLMLCAAIDF
jgi:hypothetical protein